MVSFARVQSNSRQALITLAIFGMALAVYLNFLTADYSYDAVASGILLYQQVLLGRWEQLFHRYHVLYLPAAATVERGVRAIGVEIDPLTLLQLLGTPFAAASVALYYRLARAIGLGTASAAICTVFFGGGFGFWFYATGGEPYPVATFFLLFSFLAAAQATAEAGRWRWIASGVSFGLAAGFHGACLLALPGLSILAWGRGRRPAVTYTLLATVAVVVLAYGARYAVVHAANRSASVATDASALSAEDWALRPQLFLEWRALAAWMAPRDVHMPDFPPDVVPAVTTALSLMMPLPLLLAFRSDRIRRDAAIGLAVWLVAMFLFFSVYCAGHPKFVSLQWAPLLLLIGLSSEQLAVWARARRVALVLLGALAVATVVLTFQVVLRQSRPEANPHLARARAIGRLTQSEDLVVHLGIGGNLNQNVYTRYFAVRRVLSLHDSAAGAGRGEPALRAMEARVVSEMARGRVVVLDDAVSASATSVEFERNHGLPEGSLARLFAAHGPARLGDDPASGPLWLLTR